MSITEIIKAIEQEETKKQKEVRLLLDDIQNMSSVEFAEEAADRLTHVKHSYSVQGYISQLKKIIRLLEAGAHPAEALEIVDSCIETDSYIKMICGKE